MHDKQLKSWQKLQNSCRSCKDIPGKGFWCSKQGIKCSFSNCHDITSPPIISIGKNKNQNSNILLKGVNGLTPKQTEILKLKNKGLSYQNIAESMNISKTAVYKLYAKASQKIGVNDKLGGLTVKPKRGLTKKQHDISLHNDSIELEIDADISLVEGKKVSLKYIDYKLIKTDDHILKVFHNKLVIQFRKEIISNSVSEAYYKATKRIKSYLTGLFIPGVSIPYYQAKQLSRHYAVLGTDIAKRYIKEGKKMFIYDKYDGNLRAIIDYSDKDKGGFPHLEFPHVDKGKYDADAGSSYVNDIINNDHYLPGQTKQILDTIMGVQKEYAYQIRRHLEVQTETLSTLKAIQNNLSIPKDKHISKPLQFLFNNVKHPSDLEKHKSTVNLLSEEEKHILGNFLFECS